MLEPAAIIEASLMEESCSLVNCCHRAKLVSIVKMVITSLIPTNVVVSEIISDLLASVKVWLSNNEFLIFIILFLGYIDMAGVLW